MNKDQVKGSVKDAAGKVQEKTGEAIGSTEQQAKGLAKQVEGKVQKNVGDAKGVLKDSGRKWSSFHRRPPSSKCDRRRCVANKRAAVG